MGRVNTVIMILNEIISTFLFYGIFHGQFTVLVFLQQIQHIYYVMYWNKSYLAKRVAFWSSLDWYTNNGKSRAFEWIGTSYDVMVHVLMVYGLWPYVSINFTNMFIATMLIFITGRVYIFNPKGVWSSPKNIPQWVKKRCTGHDVE